MKTITIEEFNKDVAKLFAIEHMYNQAIANNSDNISIYELKYKNALRDNTYLYVKFLMQDYIRYIKETGKMLIIKYNDKPYIINKILKVIKPDIPDQISTDIDVQCVFKCTSPTNNVCQLKCSYTKIEYYNG